MKTRRRTILLTLTAILATGCHKAEEKKGDATPLPDTSTVTPTPEATLTWIQSNLFDVGGSKPGCAAAGCHSSTGRSPRLGDKAQSFASLINVAAGEDPSKKYVAPGDAANSYLVIKLETGGAAGVRMPQNNPSYFSSHPDELQAVKDWINNGALNN